MRKLCGATAPGSVTITENLAAGSRGGKGALEYRAQTYPFQVLGTAGSLPLR